MFPGDVLAQILGVCEGDDRRTYLVFTPDGKLLAVGSADKTIRLWSIANPARPVQVGHR